MVKSDDPEMGTTTDLSTFTVPQLYMHFKNGQKCYDGPEREVTVIAECGATTSILTVEENGKCLYEIQIQTPAACSTKTSIDWKKVIEQWETSFLIDTKPNLKDEL
jgi:hypothetical protein